MSKGKSNEKAAKSGKDHGANGKGNDCAPSHGNNGHGNDHGGHGNHGHGNHGHHGTDFVYGTAGDDRIHAGNGKDFVFAGPGDDKIFGGNGKDFIFGGSGGDKIFGGNGKDLIKGGGDGDAIFGGRAKDVILGGDGDDIISGGKGKDSIAGGDDDGTFQFVEQSGNLLLNGSFEDGPEMQPESWAFFDNGVLPDWTNLGGNVTEIWTPPLTALGVEIEPTDGSRVIETDAQEGEDNYAQTVSLDAGGPLVLTFDYASRPGVHQEGNATDSFEIWWNGEMVGAFDPDSVEWQSATIEVVGLAGDNLLEIREGGVNDNHGALLDNFVLQWQEAESLIAMDGGDHLWGGKHADTFFYAWGDGVDTIHDYDQREGDKIVLKLDEGISHETMIQGDDAYIVFRDGAGYVENAAIKVAGVSDASDLDIHLYGYFA